MYFVESRPYSILKVKAMIERVPTTNWKRSSISEGG
jgi:hypothetical protein